MGWASLPVLISPIRFVWYTLREGYAYKRKPLYFAEGSELLQYFLSQYCQNLNSGGSGYENKPKDEKPAVVFAGKYIFEEVSQHLS